MSSPAVFETDLKGLTRIHRGKVRDIYALDDGHLLFVATDRLSAFDVVLPDPIPGKGEVLTRISNFWFSRTRHIVPNHLTDYELAAYVHDRVEPAELPAAYSALLYQLSETIAAAIKVEMERAAATRETDQ